MNSKKIKYIKKKNVFSILLYTIQQNYFQKSKLYIPNLKLRLNLKS